MPKVTLSYNLPEEQEEFELASKGARYSYIIDEFDNWLRAELKYNDKLTDQEHDIYQTVRDKLWSFRHDD